MTKRLFLVGAVTAALAAAQGLDSATLLKPLGESWPTYSGDYSGKRYSSLTHINQSNVKNLTLAWTSRVAAGPGGRGSATIMGGEGTGELSVGGGTNIRASILQVNGILYLSTPDNAWAIDARDGHELWHYFWKTRGGTHIGNRGLGMYGNWLYMETPDDYLISLDARTGKERWHKVIASFDEQYFSTTAPIVVGNHVLVGTGDDLDEPGVLQAFDPENGALVVLPTIDGKRGNPVVWSRRFFPELAALGGDVGARHLIASYPEAVAEVPVAGQGALVDVDTPDALKELKAEIERA